MLQRRLATKELYVQGIQEQQLPGIEPPHCTNEDYRSRHWANYVSCRLSGSDARLGVPRGVHVPQPVQAGPGGLGWFRRCAGWMKGKHGRPTGRPYPHDGPSRTGGTRVYPPLCGRNWRPQHTRPPHGAPPSPKRCRQGRRDSGVSATVWGEVESPQSPDPPTGVPIPRRPREYRGDSGVSAVVWVVRGCAVISHPPTGHPYPLDGPGKTGAARVYSPLCGGVNGRTCMFPHGAPLSPKRPRQDQRVSGVSAVVWGDGEGNGQLLP